MEPSHDLDEASSSTKSELIIIKKMETLLENAAKSLDVGGEGDVRSRCIFKIPQSLKKIHLDGYEPKIVSIGPYHHGKENLKMMERHKHHFLKFFLDQATDHHDNNILCKKILEKETALKNSYSEKREEDQPTFLKMMLLDGCFILTLFFLLKRIGESPKDPILNTKLFYPTLKTDLLLLENQVPFILLKILWKESNIPHSKDNGLKALAFNFFGCSALQEEVGEPQHFLDLSPASQEEFGESQHLLDIRTATQEEVDEPKHLLDLIRKYHIPKKSNNAPNPKDSRRLILSAKRLRLQGIKFKASKEDTNKAKSLLDIKLDSNLLRIPEILLDGFMSSFLLNSVAFEQLYPSCDPEHMHMQITSYVVFMRCLMNDEADATYLNKKGIIQFYYGNGDEVSKFFRNITKDIAFDGNKNYFYKEFKGIQEYTSNKWNVKWAEFKKLYIGSPWSFLSALAVLIGIGLSIFQATLAGIRHHQSLHK